MMLRKAFCCFYALTKELVNFDFITRAVRKNPQLKFLVTICTSILTILLLFTLFLTTLPFIIYKSIIQLYLKLRYRNFGGFLTGTSSNFENEENKFTIITVFMLEDHPEIYKQLQEIAKNVHESNYMLSSIVESGFGYKYYLKNQVHHKQVISKVRLNNNKNITNDELVNYLENFQVNENVERKLWEIILFEQLFQDENGQEKRAFMVRINHCITDAYFMIALFKRLITDNCQKKRNPIPKIDHPSPALDDLYVNSNPLAKPMREYLFHGSDKLYVTVFTENNLNYVPRIKAIKNKLSVGFTDVLLAGLVASTSDFLRKKLGTCSNKVNVFTTSRGRMEDIPKLLNDTFDESELSNEFAMMAFSVSTTKERESAIYAVQHMHRMYTQAKLSVDATLGYICTNFQWTFFPTYLQKTIFHLMLKYCCLVSTNMAAVEKLYIRGQEIYNAFSFTPIVIGKGMMMSTVTYDNRLHTVLQAKEKFLDSRAELQEIMDGVFSFIDVLEKEVNTLSPVAPTL